MSPTSEIVEWITDPDGIRYPVTIDIDTDDAPPADDREYEDLEPQEVEQVMTEKEALALLLPAMHK
jgi:hypothetical protein